MSYKVEPIDVLSTPKERIVDPRSKKNELKAGKYKWWGAQTDNDLLAQALSTVEFLKKTNLTRIRQASVFARLNSGKPLYNFLAANSTLDSSNQLPIGRPTANVCYSCTDTVVSLLSQDRPKPVFLSDGGDYKHQKLAKQGNAFIQGELYRTNAYQLQALQLRDACMLGDGFVKSFPKDGKVNLDRVLSTEILTDFNDSYYGKPQELFQLKLLDRDVAMAYFEDKSREIMTAAAGNVDSTPRSTETVADQFIAAEGWHLPSSPDSDDGRHIIVSSAGIILDEKWVRSDFPFDKLSYNPNPVGYFSQGLTEILMPTQMELYRMLIVASQAIELMGVPRIYIDQLSEIMETSFNNRVGTIIKGKGVNPPVFLNATSNAPEIYQWILFLIQNAYQMSGVSSMAAQAKKSPGLNSGEAIREANDLQSARFAALERRYQESVVHKAELVIEDAKSIVEETGKYTTVYPGKNGIEEVDFKNIDLLKDSYVIQIFEESSLPKDPEGRQAKLSEMRADGEISQQEFRRLSNFPDLEQSDRLASALENRILHALDEIVDNGKADWKGYADIAPDNFILDPTDLATTLVVNYINLYSTLNLEEEKLQVLRDWYTQVQGLKARATPPPVQAAPAPQSAGEPQTPPTAPPAAPIGATSGVQV